MEDERRVIEEVGSKLGMKELDDWYSQSNRTVTSSGGATVLYRYKGSLLLMLRTIFPEKQWDPKKFKRLPRNYWADSDNQRAALDEVAFQLGFKKREEKKENSKRNAAKAKEVEEEMEGWYKTTLKAVIEHGGSMVLRQFDNSLSKALTSLYPSYPWDLGKFSKVPHNFWNSLENQHRLLNDIGGKLGVNTKEAWYKVSNQDIVDQGGSALLMRYHGSLPAVLEAIYPETPWDPLRFSRAPRNHWQSLENQREFMDSIARKLGMKDGDRDGWYKITAQTLFDNGGRSIFQKHKSMLSLLRAVYPEHEWVPLKFDKAPQYHWASIENQRAFMDDLGRKLGMKEGEREGWYAVSYQQLSDHDALSLVAFYNGSVPDLLAAVYPDFDWKLWKFVRRPRLVRKSPKAFPELLEAVEKALDIKKPSEWYRITQEQLATIGLRSVVVKHFGELLRALEKRYPEEKWDPSLFLGRGYRKASQRWLHTLLERLFVGAEIVESGTPEGLSPLQLDVYLPAQRLAFEYQGVQHYEQLSVFGEAKERMEIDNVKAARCEAIGITLIAVPYWWNKSRGPLLAQLLAVRPDLFEKELKDYLGEAQRAKESEERLESSTD